MRDALEKGFDDFAHKPSHVFFLSLIYPVVGLILFRLTFGHDLLPLLYPLAAGFALLGPFAAIGFYEISRRREEHLNTSWWQVLKLRKSKSIGAILALGALSMAIYLVWLWSAEAIYESIFGMPVRSVSGFLHQVFGTPEGLKLMLIGNAVGFVFAAVIFSISVVAFPMLVDRGRQRADGNRNLAASRADEPGQMAAWALFIAVALAVASVPFLLGLVIVLPVLGHASWHLYRKLVVH